MNLRAIISAEKTEIKIGPWHTGKVPKADFPVSKSALRVGNSFDWCVVTFNARDAECRVLVMINTGKEKFDAVLGVMAGSMLRVLCAYQYHATEPGWHVHATCDSVGKIPAGFFRGPWVRRIPAGSHEHRRKDFALSGKTEALRCALKRYRIEAKGPLL